MTNPILMKKEQTNTTLLPSAENGPAVMSSMTTADNLTNTHTF